MHTIGIELREGWGPEGLGGAQKQLAVVVRLPVERQPRRYLAFTAVCKTITIRIQIEAVVTKAWREGYAWPQLEIGLGKGRPELPLGIGCLKPLLPVAGCLLVVSEQLYPIGKGNGYTHGEAGYVGHFASQRGKIGCIETPVTITSFCYTHVIQIG